MKPGTLRSRKAGFCNEKPCKSKTRVPRARKQNFTPRDLVQPENQLRKAAAALAQLRRQKLWGCFLLRFCPQMAENLLSAGLCFASENSPGRPAQHCRRAAAGAVVLGERALPAARAAVPGFRAKISFTRNMLKKDDSRTGFRGLRSPV